MNFPKLLLQLLYGKRLPTTSGSLYLTGPQEEIIIQRDRYGIPYIQAQNIPDAYYALGFCQGQDRAFQLEMLLRICRGTLAEVVGESGLTMDKLARRIGFYRYGQGHFEALATNYKQYVEAFARGITDGAARGCPKPDHGFALLRTTPTPWTGSDVFSGGNYVSLWLSSWTEKLSRLIVIQKDGIEALKALNASYATWLPTIDTINQPAGPNIDRLAEDLSKLAGLLGFQGASNNWVLNATRTKTGRPIVANDPHLGPTLPAPWYLVHMQAPGLSVAGASFVGMPFIPSGHNQNAAWGVTSSFLDNIDLFIEEIGPDRKTVKEADQFVPLETRRESYSVKDGDTFTEDILITKRGPIISDMLEGCTGEIALSATWMKPRPPHGMQKLHHAANVDDCKMACGEMYLASQSLVFADTQGDIGWSTWGEVPDRGGAWGVLPLPGWDPNFYWKEEYIPFEEMPNLKNPACGFIVTANAKPKTEDGSTYIGHDFADGYRHARIAEVLDIRKDWDLAGMMNLQTDQYAIPWREIKDYVLAAPAADESGQIALDLLKDWDGVTAADSPGAAVYAFFMMEMDFRRAKAKAPKSGEWALGKGFHPMVLGSFFPSQFTSHLVTQLQEQPDGWFEDGWSLEIAKALSSAARRMKSKLGENPSSWGWGQVHQLTLSHPIGASAPLAKVYNRGPFPSGGDHQTVAQAGRATLEWGANVTGLANLRTAWDVGNWENNHIVIVGGQSGNPFSPHYDDLLQYWLRGEAIKMPWSDESIKQNTKHTLQLIPE